MIRTAASNLAIMTANFATGLLAARFLEADGRGEFALVCLYPQIVATAGLLGLDRSISILFGQRRLPAPTRSLLILAALTAVPSTVVAAVVVRFAVADPGLRQLGYLLCLYVPAHQVFTLSVSGLMGRGCFRGYNTSRLVLNYTYLGLAIAGIVLGPGEVLGFVVAYLAACLIGASAALVSFAREAGRREPIGDGGPVTWGRLPAFNLPFVVPAVLYTFAARIDQIVLAIWLEPRDLGVFVVYISFASLISPVASAVNATMFHRSIAKEPGFSPLGVARLAQLSYLLFLVVMSVFAGTAIQVFYGPSFTADIGAARILLVAVFFLFSSHILNEFMKGQRTTAPDLAANGAYLLVILVTGSLLAHRWGLLGMALAVMTGNLARYSAIAWFFFRRRIGSVSDLLPRPADAVLLLITVRRLFAGLRAPSA